MWSAGGAAWRRSSRLQEDVQQISISANARVIMVSSRRRVSSTRRVFVLSIAAIVVPTLSFLGPRNRMIFVEGDVDAMPVVSSPRFLANESDDNPRPSSSIAHSAKTLCRAQQHRAHDFVGDTKVVGETESGDDPPSIAHTSSRASPSVGADTAAVLLVGETEETSDESHPTQEEAPGTRTLLFQPRPPLRRSFPSPGELLAAADHQDSPGPPGGQKQNIKHVSYSISHLEDLWLDHLIERMLETNQRRKKAGFSEVIDENTGELKLKDGASGRSVVYPDKNRAIRDEHGHMIPDPMESSSPHDAAAYLMKRLGLTETDKMPWEQAATAEDSSEKVGSVLL